MTKRATIYLDEELHRLLWLHLVEDATQGPRELERVLGDDLLFLPRAGLLQVDGGVDTPVGELALQHQLDPAIELVRKYGADTVRLFLMFMGPWDQGGPWNPQGIEGINRFLRRVWTVTLDPTGQEHGDPDAGRLPDGQDLAGAEKALRVAAHKTLQGVTADQHGNLFVADQGNGRIHVLDRRQRFQPSIGDDFGLRGTPTAPVDVAVGPGELLAVTDRSRSAILVYQIIYE